MSVVTYGVTVARVLEALPFGTGGLNATSQPLNTEQIEDMIAEGAGRVSGALGNGGVSPASLGDDATAHIAGLIVAYCVGRCLGVLGMGDDASARAALDEYAAELATLRSRASVVSGGRRRARTNVDTSDPLTRKYGRRYEW